MSSKEKSYFESFRKVVKAVGSTLSVKEVLGLLAENVTEVMSLKACAIRLLNAKTRTLDLVSSFGLSEGYLKKGPVDADKSIADALEGNTVIITDVSKDPRAQYPKEAAAEGIVGIVSVPLAIKGRVIGVMRLYTGKPKKFGAADLNFAESLAEMGAIAIENAKMYEKIKKDYENVMSDVFNFTGYRRSL